MNHEAIYALYPQTAYIRGEDAFDANDNPVQYDKVAVQAYIDANAYKYQRAAEYPSFADQFDTIYHDGIDAWKEQINTIKEKYPKG